MNKIHESAENFEAGATIAYCYFALNKINKESKPKYAIDAMIDKACGFDPMEKHYPEMIDLLETIIEKKAIIDEDSTRDKEMLEMIKAQVKL